MTRFPRAAALIAALGALLAACTSLPPTTPDAPPPVVATPAKPVVTDTPKPAPVAPTRPAPTASATATPAVPAAPSSSPPATAGAAAPNASSAPAASPTTSWSSTSATPAAPAGTPAAAPPANAASEPEAAGLPTDPMRPESPLRFHDAEADLDLWARLRKGFGMNDLDSELVRDRERWYTSRPDYVQRMTERGSRYLFHIVEELERRKMPTELALLPFIESAFNPQAMSSARASGMWQFIPSTGRTFALKQNVFRDDRRDVLASTRAALDYLQKLYGMFGDWHLALAAYNWGEGSVQRAIARNQKAGLPTDYASLSMPNETRYYVPKFQAVKNIIARPDAFGVTLPALQNHPYFASVPIQRDIDASLAARLAGLPMDEFRQLNPSLNKPVILAAGTPQVLMPYDNADRFVQNLRAHRGPLASWTAWVVPRTMRPGAAAQQVGMSEAQLREVNRIPPRMLVKAGSTLLVPRSERKTQDVSEHLADNATMQLAPDAPPMKRVSFRARRGDSVASIARRYRLGAAQVAQWNRVGAQAQFAAGQVVVVYVASKPVRGRQAAASHRSAVRGGKAVAGRHAVMRKPVAKAAHKARR